MSLAYRLIKIYEISAGRNFSPYYESFKRNEFSDYETLQSIQFNKLKKLVNHAFETVPFYKERFNTFNINPDEIKSIEDIKALPFLTKSDLQSNFDRLISTSYKRSSLIKNSTGGSTGKPTNFLMTKEGADARAAVAFKSFQMTGWDFLKKTIHLTGSPIEVTASRRMQARVKSFLMRQKKFSAFDLTEDKLSRLCLYIQRKRPEVLLGFVSALLSLSEYVEIRKLKLEIPIIIQMAEMIYPDQVEYIERSLGGKFFKKYGARDATAMGMECKEQRGFHVNMDSLYIEILRNGKETFDEDGEVFITDLYSFGMPLIRYQMGDVGMWKKESCVCGRRTPLFDITRGRITNIISTKDGKITSGLFIPHLFKEVSGKVHTYKVYQPDIDHLIIKIVKQKEFQKKDEQYLEEKLRAKIGSQIEITFEYLDEIISEASGKHQFVKSEVPVKFGNR